MAAQHKKKVIKSSTARPKKAPVRRKAEQSKPTNAFTHYTDFLFTRNQYILLGAGVVVIILGMLLMAGGQMPDNDTWDPGIIYSFRRITLAPILILAGLAFQVYVIFKR